MSIVQRGAALAISNADWRRDETEIADSGLATLLVSGGDDRLAVDPVTRLNTYGCSADPHDGVLSFASSTASSISHRAYRRAVAARIALEFDGAARGRVEAFDAAVERMRGALAACLEIDGSGTEIVFSPSGTDSQLHALFLTRAVFGGPLATVVVAADQTGSGTAHTRLGRHFSVRTAQGTTVEKGAPIDGVSDIESIGISLFAPDGTVRSTADVDASVIAAVAGKIAEGRKVVLQAMDSSKLGWRAPSDGCLRHISACWPDSVQIVVDACQMRIGRKRLRDHLDRGFIVLVTGSKFFGGPPFSGAALVPAALAGRARSADTLPEGCAAYTTRFDLPLSWHALREQLPAAPNLGQWLRWEAALEEMRTYYALPEAYRRTTLALLAGTIPALINSSKSLEILPGPSATVGDDEMPVPTIFSFLVTCNGRPLSHDETRAVYRMLNRDISGDVPRPLFGGERILAATPCHVGQPVKLPDWQGKPRTVLRIAIGARHLTDAWSDDEAAARENIRMLIEQVGAVVNKIDLIVGAGLHARQL